jgi:hypothetical protein
MFSLHPEDQAFFINSSFSRRVEHALRQSHSSLRADQEELEGFFRAEMSLHLSELYQRGVLTAPGINRTMISRAADQLRVVLDRNAGSVTIYVQDVIKHFGFPCPETGCRFEDERFREPVPQGRFVDIGSED